MKTALSPSMRHTECGSEAGTNCGRNAKKKIVSLGLSRFRVMPATITCRTDCFSCSSPIDRAPVSRQVDLAIQIR